MTQPPVVTQPSVVAQPAVEVRGASKTFGHTDAVTDLSMTVRPGRITGFLGPNGSGKSTTLRMILGLVTPTAGECLIEGVPARALREPATVVGAVLDSQRLHPRRTARAHLLVHAAAAGVPDSRADEVLAEVGLSSVARTRIGTFSLGMRGRLALATALLGRPRILVLDEPANGLDPQGIAWLRSYLTGFARSGGTVLISSHILGEVAQIVDDVVIVSGGSAVYRGTVEELRRAQHRRLLVAAADPAGLARALAADGVSDVRSLRDGRIGVVGAAEDRLREIANAAGIAVFGVVAEEVDLEQLFLAMTAPHYVAGATALAPGGYGPPTPPYSGPPPPAGPYPPQYPQQTRYPHQQQYPQPGQYPPQQQYPPHPPQPTNPGGPR